jgi:hypothetical protein
MPRRPRNSGVSITCGLERARSFSTPIASKLSSVPTRKRASAMRAAVGPPLSWLALSMAAALNRVL